MIFHGLRGDMEQFVSACIGLAAALGLVACGSGSLKQTPPAHEQTALRAPIDTLALLEARQFQTVDRHFAAVQATYDKGDIGDQDLRKAFNVFKSPKEALEDRYDGWVSMYPRSYVARLARGIYYVNMGDAHRGKKTIRETPEAELSTSESFYNKAMADLLASMDLDEKPLLSFVNAIFIARQNGDPETARKWLDRAIQIDPRNYSARAAYMSAIETRWGGDQDKMNAFLKESRGANLSQKQMNLLESVVIEDQGWIHLFRERDYAAAVVAYRRSGELGGDRETANVIYALSMQGKFREEVAVIEAELELKPADPTLLHDRGEAYFKLNMAQEGLDDIRAAAEGGNSDAQNEMGRFYMLGLPGYLDRDIPVGLEWFKKSAAQGNSAGQENLRRAQQLSSPSGQN
jgi:tetratricopeptide (TPR) repeat protein